MSKIFTFRISYFRDLSFAITWYLGSIVLPDVLVWLLRNFMVHLCSLLLTFSIGHIGTNNPIIFRTIESSEKNNSSELYSIHSSFIAILTFSFIFPIKVKFSVKFCRKIFDWLEKLNRKRK